MRSLNGIWIAGLVAMAAAPASAEVPQPPSRALNPDIGLNFLGLFRRNSRGTNDRQSLARNGFVFQESELQFSADVDPHFRAVGNFAVKQEEASTDFGVDPEEVFLETLALPVVTMRAGKFKAALGKHNQLHTHAFPFIDAPLINQDLFGEEGLGDVGVSASALLPLQFFSELTVQGVSAGNETLYGTTNSGKTAGVAQWRNLFELSDVLTFEAALFGTSGKNRFEQNSRAYGGELILKWRPEAAGKDRSLSLHAQALRGRVRGNPDGEKLEGVAGWLQYQFCQRWWVQGRSEYADAREGGVRPTQTKQSALLGYFPSEFSGLRLQYDALNRGGQRTGHAVALQWNISIGAHPAHAY